MAESDLNKRSRDPSALIGGDDGQTELKGKKDEKKVVWKTKERAKERNNLYLLLVFFNIISK